jgi:hypothetical protein
MHTGAKFPNIWWHGESRGLTHANRSKQIRGPVGTESIIGENTASSLQLEIKRVTLERLFCVCNEANFNTFIAQSTQEATPLYFFSLLRVLVRQIHVKNETKSKSQTHLTQFCLL